MTESWGETQVVVAISPTAYQPMFLCPTKGTEDTPDDRSRVFA
jgi:hypothetical protein